MQTLLTPQITQPQMKPAIKNSIPGRTATPKIIHPFPSPIVVLQELIFCTTVSDRQIYLL
jgi:hypothetical protein